MRSTTRGRSSIAVIVAVVGTVCVCGIQEESESACTGPTTNAASPASSYIQSRKLVGVTKDTGSVCSCHLEKVALLQSESADSPLQCADTCHKCDCPMSWTQKCGFEVCYGCDECQQTTTTTDYPPPEGVCESYGDPHVHTFDDTRATLLLPGDFWIVHNEHVFIQARYLSGMFANGNEANAGTVELGIGGPFLDGHELVIRPNTKAVTHKNPNGFKETVLAELGGPEFEVEGLITATYTEVDHHTRGKAKQVSIVLPFGVKITVNRWKENLDFVITMPQLPGGQDGHCGNFNGDKSDDTKEELKKRNFNVPFNVNFFEPHDFSGASTEEPTLDDCDDKEAARESCDRKLDASADDYSEDLESCMFDVCFGGPEFADQDGVAQEVGAAAEEAATCTDEPPPRAIRNGWQCNSDTYIQITDRGYPKLMTPATPGPRAYCNSNYWKKEANRFCALTCEKYEVGYLPACRAKVSSIEDCGGAEGWNAIRRAYTCSSQEKAAERCAELGKRLCKKDEIKTHIGDKCSYMFTSDGEERGWLVASSAPGCGANYEAGSLHSETENPDGNGGSGKFNAACCVEGYERPANIDLFPHSFEVGN